MFVIELDHSLRIRNTMNWCIQISWCIYIFFFSSFRDSTCTDQDLPAGMAGDELNEFNGIDKIFEGTTSFVPVPSLPFCFISANSDLPEVEGFRVITICQALPIFCLDANFKGFDNILAWRNGARIGFTSFMKGLIRPHSVLLIEVLLRLDQSYNIQNRYVLLISIMYISMALENTWHIYSTWVSCTVNNIHIGNMNL